MKIVRGQSLCQMVVEVVENEDSKEGGWENEVAMYQVESTEVVNTPKS